MLRRIVRGASLAIALATAACLGSTEVKEVPTLADPATVTFAPALGVDLATMTKTATGLYYKDAAVGAGTAATATDSVALNLAGYLSSGEQIARSRGSPPSEARLTTLLPGLREGITGMRPGGTRKLVLPPQLAFGFAAQPAVESFPRIPANSVLVFDVELVRVIP